MTRRSVDRAAQAPQAARSEWAAWLRLVASPGLAPGLARRLLASFGSAEAIFDASPAALRQVAGPDGAAAIDPPPPDLEARVAATAAWLEAAPADAPRHLVALGDPHYPEALLQIADPPLLLFATGRLELLAAPAVAVVGSRRATPQGLDNARTFARFLSQHGFAVVSGLALGIDGAAHEGALDGPGSTIAVVGTGLDEVYPRRHQALAGRIAREGLIISEYLLSTPPLAQNFPRRNRLIAGLGQGTLVVEAALPSGSLITASCALEAGREVFAIPGSIHSAQSHGCHHLIRQGATLVETGDDLLQELRPLQRPLPLPLAASTAAPTIDPVLAALGFDPLSLDELCARTGMAPSELGPRLLALELEGRVGRLPGGQVQRRATA